MESGKSFRIAGFNCYNLVRQGVGFYDDAPYSENEFRDKIAWSANLLSQARADLVGFQEVFSEGALKELVAATPNLANATVVAPGAELHANEIDDLAHPGRKKALMPKVGLATNVELLDCKSIADFPVGADLRFPDVDPETGEEALVELPLRRFQRPILKARIRLANGIAATVFVAHLKSKRPSLLEKHGESGENPLHKALGSVRSLIIRAAEAAALRALVLDVIDDPEDAGQGISREPLILIGDLNDSDLAVTTNVATGERPFIFSPFETKKKIWDTLLYNVHRLQAEQSLSKSAYSYIYDGQYEILDHILLSEEFHRGNKAAIGEFRNVRILNDHLLDISQTDQRRNRIVSDHGVPVVEIKLKSVVSDAVDAP